MSKGVAAIACAGVFAGLLPQANPHCLLCLSVAASLQKGMLINYWQGGKAGKGFYLVPVNQNSSN